MYTNKFLARFCLTLILATTLTISCKSSSGGGSDNNTTNTNTSTTNPLNLIVSIAGYTGTTLELLEYTQHNLAFTIQGTDLNANNLLIALRTYPQGSTLANNTTLSPTMQWYSDAAGQVHSIQLIVRDKEKCKAANASSCEFTASNGIIPTTTTVQPNYTYDSTFNYTISVVNSLDSNLDGTNTDPDIWDQEYWTDKWNSWFDNQDTSLDDGLTDGEQGLWDYVQDAGDWIWNAPSNFWEWLKGLFGF